MTDRTTINIPKWIHQEAKEVKQDDPNVKSWADVLAFYIEYQPKVSNGDIGGSQEPMQDVDTSDMEVEVSVTDIDALQERLDRIESAQANTVSDSMDIAEGGIRDVLNRLDDLETHIDGRFDEVTH